MRTTVLLLACFLFSFAHAQNDAFERRISAPGSLQVQGAAMDEDGNYYFAGEDEGDIVITKISSTGQVEWCNKYPYFTDEGIYADALRVGPDGIVFGGFTMGTGTGSRDGVILHVDLDGTLVQAKRIDVQGASNAIHGLENTSDGGFIAVGRASIHDYDMLLTKLNSQGEMQWSRTYGTPGWDWAYHAIELADGGFIMVGYGDSLGTSSIPPSGYIVRTDALGNELWARSLTNGTRPDELYCVAEATDGSIYVGGRSLAMIGLDISAFVTKLSSTGQHLWTRALEHGIEAWQLLPTADGGVEWLIHPQYFPGGSGDSRYDIAWGAFDGNGNQTWSRYYSGPTTNYGMAMFNLGGAKRSIFGISMRTIPPSGVAPIWDAQLVVTDDQGHMACNELDVPLNWVDVTSLVTVAPYTSLTSSGFDAFAWPMGTQAMPAGDFNPCCADEAAFTIAPLGDYSWSFTDQSTGASGWLWDFGDGNTSTEENPVHTYAVNGSYTVCLTITGECDTPTTCQAVSVTVGIAEAHAPASMPAIYPLPATAQFNVESKGASITELQLTDGTGRVVRTLTGLSVRKVVVATEDLPGGVYFVRTTLAGNITYSSKVIIMP